MKRANMYMDVTISQSIVRIAMRLYTSNDTTMSLGLEHATPSQLFDCLEYRIWSDGTRVLA